ncbi:MAG: penicillin-binding protein 2 [Aphanocapsa sp. GSE-SYN-MK-11-07L]|nr:penicillin-binding protein 2 [Aphanocapsa sp. GSE-SYN-MK-11-07L]
MTSTSARRSRTSAPRSNVSAPPPPQPSKFRLWLIGLFLVVGQVGLAARLIYLQIYATKALQQQAQGQQQVSLPPLVARYPIVDRRLDLLAADQPAFTLFAHPFLFKPPETNASIAAKLSPLLKQPAAKLEKLFGTAKSGIPVEYELSEETASQIRNLKLDGLELNREWKRIYPQEELTSGIIGYVDRDHQGQAGLEYSQAKLLQAPPQSRILTGDGAGFLLPNLAALDPVDPTSRYSLRLTIDVRLQRVARTALRQQLNKFGAKRGTVIVMDIKNGALLALVSEPSFNPNLYYKADPALFRNWAVADLYEPGSTFKPVNAAIALENKAITPDTTLYDEGRIFVGGWPIQNNDFSSAGGRGALSIAQVLGVSSNVGMVHMMQRVRAATYYDFLKRLGLGSKTDTDLSFETPGQFKPRDQFVNYPIEPATTAFGQGFSITPIQMAQLTAAVSNGGKLVTPHVMQGLFDRKGKLVKAPNIPPPRRVFSAQTSQQVVKMMGYVVTNGTGKSAQVPGYRLGGKTGTAQKAINGTYSNKRITGFVGVFPLESPRYVLLTVVDEPQGDNAYGSTVSIPVVKSVLESLITIEGVPPSHPQEIKSVKP